MRLWDISHSISNLTIGNFLKWSKCTHCNSFCKVLQYRFFLILDNFSQISAKSCNYESKLGRIRDFRDIPMHILAKLCIFWIATLIFNLKWHCVVAFGDNHFTKQIFWTKNFAELFCKAKTLQKKYGSRRRSTSSKTGSAVSRKNVPVLSILRNLEYLCVTL